MTDTLKGKVALVTGGSRGIGRDTARALAERGADVVITYRNQVAAAEDVVRGLQGLGVRAAALPVDLAECAQIDSFAGAFLDTLKGWGRSTFDILVNNAGQLRLGTFDSTQEDDLDAIYRVNFKAPYFLTQRLADHIEDGGRIVNLGSGTARIAFGPLVAYGPMKAALQSLTLYWASHFGSRQITANAVAPGGLEGDFNAPLFDRMPQARDYIASNTAVGRVGLPGDVAGVIAFLAEPAAAFVNGAVLNVDGGYHL